MATTKPSSASAVESRVPTLATIEEEAEFWDTHSFEEFADELEEVDDIMIGGILAHGVLRIGFTGEVLAALEVAAKEAETNPAALVYTWVLEHLGLKLTER